MVRDVVSRTELTHEFLHLEVLWARHVAEQVVFYLEIKSAEDMEDKLGRIDVARRAYLVYPASRLPFREYRTALVIWSEHKAHVHAHTHEVHDEEANARD